MVHVTIVWLTYTNILQSVYIRVIFIFSNIFNTTAQKTTKFTKDVENIFVDTMSVKKIQKFIF